MSLRRDDDCCLPKKRGDALAAFPTRAQSILDEWTRQLKVGSERRAESPNSWFKREAYKFLRAYIEAGWTSVFHHVIEGDGRPNRLVAEATRNPFKLGLLAMFSDESPLSRNNRHVFGNQMLFAWAHDVPWDFLNAFLGVSGSPALIASKLKIGEAEPGFEHRFVRERLALAQ